MDYFHFFSIQHNTFFEFNDRLEAILDKAYIYRYVLIKFL